MKEEKMVQLFKFCCVGLSSTIIDKSIFLLTLNALGTRWWTVCTCIAFCFGVTNGFYWNRRWTFKIGEKADGGKQYIKFVMTNLIGLALNLFITKIFLSLMLGHVGAPNEEDKTKVVIASLCAVPLVVIWNFTAARLWTFKAGKKELKQPEVSPSNVPPVTSP